ncbi:MAG: PDZ domain-containing protein [Caldimonas sp.]
MAATPGTVTLATSDSPLQVSCRAADGVLNTVGAQGSSRPLTGGGGVVGGVAGGAAMGAAVGATALAFIPVFGVLVLATGAVAGAVTGQTIESHARALRYPERIDVPMSCPPNPAMATVEAPGARLGAEVRGLSRAETLAAGLGDRGGVLVSSVTGNGRAAIAGLRSGDVILSLDGRELSGAAQLEEGLRAAGGAPLSLSIWRGGEVQVLLLAAGEVKP